ncbi:MAG: TAXI family TRAP transporter solute-binding subunit [Campylobacterota bacterium]|nr:TAXI family TRAP transporter solute-binding subunit [Campylobacterota bacterium]
MNNLSKIWILVFFILLIVIYIIVQLTSPVPKKEITLATGAIGSDSYAYGLSYQALLKEEGVTLKLIPTQGSLDTVGYLNTKKADIGFVHSGVLLNQREYNFESLATVYNEPLWIFYRNDGYDMNYIIEATGKKIGISITNDGTYDLTNKLSTQNKLTKNVESSYIYDKQALNQLKDKNIDIFITLATLENQYIQELLEDPNIEVMHIKRREAYLQQFEYLTSLDLYEGSINLYKNIPSKNTKILSTTQNLVSNKNIPDELIRIFLKKVTSIHGQLSLKHIDTEVNEEAKIYIENGETWLETVFPYWIASNIDRLKLFIIPLIWLIIPLFKSIIPLYIFTIRSKIFKWYGRLEQLNKRLKDKNESLDIIIDDLKILKNDIESKTKVPLSYMGEYYNLIVHIELLENKIHTLNTKKETNV